MKFWHLIFMAFFANYYSLNQTTECVNLLSNNCEGKMRPSFEEIFGKGWDKEEKKQQKMDKSAQQNNEQGNGEGNCITNDQTSENEKKERQSKNSDQKKEDQLTDREKRVIIEKFHLIKEKLKEKGKLEKSKWAKIERQIGGQLGVSRDKIYKWKKELGIAKMRKCYTDQEKKTIVEKFHLIKEKLKENGKFSKSKWVKIEHQIGRQLGVSRDKIYKWKRELGIGKIRKFSDQQKRDIIEQFDLIKEKATEIWNFAKINIKKMECQIGKQLGACRTTIYNWKREFGKSRKNNKKKNNNYYKQKKNEFIERLDEFKKKLRKGGKKQKIAKELGISERTLQKWISELGLFSEFS